jgi:hypothetical protein
MAEQLHNPSLWFGWRSEIRLLAPAGFPDIEEGGKEVIDGPAIFPTAGFSGRSRSIEWLKSS